MAYEQFNAIIVDSDTHTRMRLKQVCASVATFGKVNMANNLAEGLERLTLAGMATDVVFISHLFGQEATGDFIRKGKETKEGQDTAYVLVLPSKDQGSAATVQNVLAGADGLLFEPYSVDQLVEITRLAARVRKERSLAREEAAIKFLLKDIISNLDALAYARSCGAEMGPAVKHFNQMCGVLKTLQPESLALYMHLVVDTFEAAPMPQTILGMKKYVGASKRIKKRVADHVTTSMSEAGAKPK